MQTLVPRQRILTELTKALADTLRIGEDVIKPSSSITRDLGGESLDFLDVNYRMEQTFGVRMARHFFLEHMEELFGEGSAIDSDGRLTEPALKLLARRYAGGAAPDLSAGLDMDEVPGFVTVDAMADVVAGILDTLPQQCRCGAAAWRSDDGTHIVCGSCGGAAVFTDGDELIRRWLAGEAAAVGLARA